MKICDKPGATARVCARLACNAAPIVDLPNVFLSPHISHVDHAWSQMFKLMVDDLERALEGDYPYFEYTPRTLENRRGMSAGSLVTSRL